MVRRRGGIMIHCSFRFYEELNDYLPPESRKRTIELELPDKATIADALEGLGLPAGKVDLILVDGDPKSLTHSLEGGERVAVYPVFEAFDISAVSRLERTPLREVRFIVDSGLGELARRLRTLGFDCYYRQGASLEDLVPEANEGKRIMLSRSERLRSLGLTHALTLQAVATKEQLLEVVCRLHLQENFRPFSRCTICNAALFPVEGDAVRGKVPAELFDTQKEFFECGGCGKIYWKGSHWERMKARIETEFPHPRE